MGMNDEEELNEGSLVEEKVRILSHRRKLITIGEGICMGAMASLLIPAWIPDERYSISGCLVSHHLLRQISASLAIFMLVMACGVFERIAGMVRAEPLFDNEPIHFIVIPRLVLGGVAFLLFWFVVFLH